MGEISVEIHGDEELIAKYKRIEEQMPGNMRGLMVKSVIYAQSQIPAYPSPPAGSTYRRTGTLGRTVTAFPGVAGPTGIGGSGGDNGGQPLTRVESIAGGVRGVVGGRLSYMPYVIDEGQQAYMHRGRWWTLQKVITGARSGIIKIWRAGVVDWFK